MSRRLLIVSLLAACDVGDVTGGMNGTGPDGGNRNIDAAGPMPLKVTFTTGQTAAPAYAPQNCVAAWVQNDQGAIMKTIGRWCETRKAHLVAWSQKAGTNDVDALTGATRLAHGELTATWDLKSRAGTEIAGGTYTIRLEATDLNALTADQNNQGTFTFVKGGMPQNQSGLSGGNFTNVTIDFKPL
jgi:hypothetical protein